MTEDKLAAIREKIAQVIFYDDINKKSHTWEEVSVDFPNVTLDCRLKADVILSIPILKTGGECPECHGRKEIYQEISEYRTPNVEPCPTCKGKGKLPGETHSLIEWVLIGMGK